MDLFKKLNDFILTITSRNENFWEQRKLGKVIERRTQKREFSDLPYIEYADIIPNIGRLNKDIFSRKNTKQGIYFQKNDILFGKLRPYLNNWLKPQFEGIAVGDFWILNGIKLNNDFLYYYIQTKKFSDVANVTTGTKMPRSDWNLVSNLKIKFPNFEEQQNIGKLFYSLENLITLYDRKLKLLSQVKKYFLDNLFAEKEYPNLRFKGFTDAWEQRKLGTITDTYSGGTPQVSVKDYYSNNEIPFIRSSDIHKNKTELYISSKGLENSSAKLVSKGHILYALYGATSGEVDISKIDGAINQAVLCINAHNDLNYFLMLFLSKNKDKIVRKYIQGGQGNLSASIIKKIKVFTTSELEETKISNLVKILSDIITLYENKQQHLTEIKKELLNTMFI